jgi:hypothetical protein
MLVTTALAVLVAVGSVVNAVSLTIDAVRSSTPHPPIAFAATFTLVIVAFSVLRRSWLAATRRAIQAAHGDADVILRHALMQRGNPSMAVVNILVLIFAVAVRHILGSGHAGEAIALAIVALAALMVNVVWIKESLAVRTRMRALPIPPPRPKKAKPEHKELADLSWLSASKDSPTVDPERA